MKPGVILCAALMAGGVGPVGAQSADLAPADPAPDCANAMTQADMNECAFIAYQKADDALNSVYKQASLAAHQAGGDAQAQLLSAQRAWIAYRDAACEAEADFRGAGGTIMPLLRASCLETMTKARTDDLRAVYLTE